MDLILTNWEEISKENFVEVHNMACEAGILYILGWIDIVIFIYLLTQIVILLSMSPIIKEL